MRLEDIIESLHQMGGDDAEKELAEIAAREIKDALTETLSAGETPEGEPWAPTKTGKRAYKNAASKLSVAAEDTLIRVIITGPEVYGNFGTGKMPQRRMLPDAGAGMPKSVEKALNRAFVKYVKRHGGGQ